MVAPNAPLMQAITKGYLRGRLTPYTAGSVIPNSPVNAADPATTFFCASRSQRKTPSAAPTCAIMAGDGVLIAEIIEGGSAAGNLEVDDVIIGIDGKRVKNFAELQEGLAKHRPGDKVTVKVLRDKKEKDIEMTLKNAQGTTKVVKSAGMDILGAAFREVPQELKRQLNLGYGVEVTGVTDGKMKAAGIRKGFIILKANGQPVKSVNDLEDVLKAATQSPDQVLFLSGMFPSGKRANYAVDLTQE